MKNRCALITTAAAMFVMVVAGVATLTVGAGQALAGDHSGRGLHHAASSRPASSCTAGGTKLEAVVAAARHNPVRLRKELTGVIATARSGYRTYGHSCRSQLAHYASHDDVTDWLIMSAFSDEIQVDYGYNALVYDLLSSCFLYDICPSQGAINDFQQATFDVADSWWYVLG
jgi:hypothetical protein